MSSRPGFVVSALRRFGNMWKGGLLAIPLILCANQAFAALPAAGTQYETANMANNTATVGAPAGFNFVNTSAYPYAPDTAVNAIYPNVAGQTTGTFGFNADGVNLGTFDLTAVSFANYQVCTQPGQTPGNFDYSFTITGYKTDGTTVTTTASYTGGNATYTPGNFASFTGITGFSVAIAGQYTVLQCTSNIGGVSNVDIVSFGMANPVAPQAPPTVTGITPNSGPTTGGTAVTITGTNFTGASSVTIGGTAATNVVVVNSTTITATTPPGSAGITNVAVTTPGGTGTGTGIFTYTSTPPTVTGITPNSGTTAGGQSVTITGTSFTGATSVTIGGVAATGITVVNSTTITATTPAGTAGAANVAVTTAAGTGTGTGLFTYVAVPTVTAISPNSGPIGGGQTVIITGTNFISGATVTIGGAAATSVVVTGSTSITAITPAGTAGAQNVVVTTSGGNSGTSGNGLYTYVTAPTVTAISPNSGPVGGGQSVTISGTSFTSGATVTIGGAAATGVVVNSSTSITAIAPPGTAGAADVVVATTGGTGTATGLYTYIAAPTVSAISPTSGPTAGGTSVTITGTGFAAGATVTIGGTAAKNIVVNSSTSITATTPVGTVGAANVAVTTAGGTGTGAGLYAYTAVPPTVTAISPNTGTIAGGTSVTITGTNFVAGATVTIGGTAAKNVVVNSSTSITATTPAGTAGAANVAVTTGGGTGTGTGLYTYQTSSLTAGAASMTVSPGSSTSIDLAKYITGGTAASIAITTAPAHGTATVSGTTVTYVAAENYAGADSFAYAATNSTGTSSPGAVSITVVNRPDPTKDADVTGLLYMQTDTARRFREAQMLNFQGHLESLHDRSVGMQTSDGSASLPPTGGNGTPGGRAGTAGNGTAGAPAGGRGFAGTASPMSPLFADQNGPGQASASPLAAGASWLTSDLMSVVTTSSISVDMGTVTQSLLSADGTGAQGGSGLRVWGAGNLRFGTRNQPVAGPGIDFTTNGATIGVDQRINHSLTLGMGVGYGRDDSSIGTDGTGSTTTGSSVSAYASYEPVDAVFIDGLLGYGTLGFDSSRYVAVVNSIARSNRSGSQTWGSLAAGYEYRAKQLLLSPYARYNFGFDRLDAATENGAGVYSLAYAGQSTKSQQISLGFRGQGQVKTGVGLATPRLRVEYQHAIWGSTQTSLAYADMISSRYDLNMLGTNVNSWLLGVGSGLAMSRGWYLDAEYQHQFAAGWQNIQSLSLRLSKSW